MHKIIYSSDLHGNRLLYERLIKKASEEDINGLVIGGDLCPRGGATIRDTIKIQKKFLEEFMLPLFYNFDKDIFLIMGNDDFRVNSMILENNNNIKYINKKSLKINNNVNIAGYSFVNPTPFRLKDWEKPDFEGDKYTAQLFLDEIVSVKKENGAIKEDLWQLGKLSDPKKTVYVIHAPPFNTKLDIIADGAHVGSKAVMEFIENEQPPLTLHGHIHESPKMSGSWKDKIGKTICVNVGSSYPEDKLNCVVIDVDDLSDMKYLELR